MTADWNSEHVTHGPDDIDEEGIARIRASVGEEGISDLDVTRSSIQKEH